MVDVFLLYTPTRSFFNYCNSAPRAIYLQLRNCFVISSSISREAGFFERLSWYRYIVCLYVWTGYVLVMYGNLELFNIVARTCTAMYVQAMSRVLISIFTNQLWVNDSHEYWHVCIIFARWCKRLVFLPQLFIISEKNLAIKTWEVSNKTWKCFKNF